LEEIILLQDVELPVEIGSTVISSASLGKEGEYFIFSHPVALTLPAPTVAEGTQVEVLTVHAEDTEFNIS